MESTRAHADHYFHVVLRSVRYARDKQVSSNFSSLVSCRQHCFLVHLAHCMLSTVSANHMRCIIFSANHGMSLGVSGLARLFGPALWRLGRRKRTKRMPPRGKRKRENGSAMAAPSASATVCDESRIVDPYGLNMRPCKLSDHHRKKNKTTVVVRNCAENPNCLFGLGEHQEVQCI